MFHCVSWRGSSVQEVLYLLRYTLKLVVVQTENLHCSQLSKTREREGQHVLMEYIATIGHHVLCIVEPSQTLYVQTDKHTHDNVQ